MKKIILPVVFRLYKSSSQRMQRRIRALVLKLDDGPMWSEWIRKIYKTYHQIDIGYGTYGGCFNLSAIPPGTSFGNYCSVAPEIRIFRANHPLNSITTHPVLYNPVVGFVEMDGLDRPPISIGHDVWIGEWAIILPTVKRIGNGAVIGAGSVVSKDVDSFTIVAGSPARVIGSRFEEKRKEEIVRSRWWFLEKDDLYKYLKENSYRCYGET